MLADVCVRSLHASDFKLPLALACSDTFIQNYSALKTTTLPEGKAPLSSSKSAFKSLKTMTVFSPAKESCLSSCRQGEALQVEDAAEMREPAGTQFTSLTSTHVQMLT
jgi:hypothetical protein